MGVPTWRRHPMLGQTDVGKMFTMGALVVIADALGHDVDERIEEEARCRGCAWRQPVVPGRPSARALADEHLLDVVVPVLVAAGDLAEDGVATFREMAVLYRHRLEELLRLPPTPT